MLAEGGEKEGNKKTKKRAATKAKSKPKQNKKRKQKPHEEEVEEPPPKKLKMTKEIKKGGVKYAADLKDLMEANVRLLNSNDDSMAELKSYLIEPDKCKALLIVNVASK